MSTDSISINIKNIAKEGDPEVVVPFKIICNRFNEATLELTFKGESKTYANGNPHFRQVIFDSLQQTWKNICYDVRGMNGYTILIFTDKETKSKILGQLVDDFYMHTVTVYSRLSNVTIDMNGVRYGKNRRINWDENFNDTSFIRKINDHVYVKPEETSQLIYIISWEKKDIGGNFLNVAVKGYENDYNNKGGLIGEMGKNNFEFYNEIQDTDKDNTISNSIALNGKLIKTSKSVKVNKECWKINLKDVFDDEKLNEYIYMSE